LVYTLSGKLRHSFCQDIYNSKKVHDMVAKSREIPTPAAKQCLFFDN